MGVACGIFRSAVGTAASTAQQTQVVPPGLSVSIIAAMSIGGSGAPRAMLNPALGQGGHASHGEAATTASTEIFYLPGSLTPCDDL